MKGTCAKFKTFVKNQTGKRMKVFRSDIGTEFVNQEMENLLSESVVATPEQNAVIGRSNRAAVDPGSRYWGYVAKTAVYLGENCRKIFVWGKGRPESPESFWV